MKKWLVGSAVGAIAVGVAAMTLALNISHAATPSSAQNATLKQQQVLQTLSAGLSASTSFPKAPQVDLAPPSPPLLPSGEPQMNIAVRQIQVQDMDPKPGLPFYGANSMWQAGSVHDGQFWNYLYVFTLPGSSSGSAQLGTWEIDGSGAYDHLFTSPQNVGQLTITSVSSQDGVVTMTSNAGQTVTFNLATDAWRFGQ